MSDKKKFKDTGFGKLLLQKVPSAAGLIGEVLPDKGLLGIVKNVITMGKKSGEISPQEAAELERLADMELAYYELDQKDRSSARTREVELARAGGQDWMMYASGLFSLASAIAIVVVVLFFEIKSGKELFYFVAGAAFGWAGQVVTYYFGSSKGSSDKTKKLEELVK